MTHHDPTQPLDALGRANPRMAPEAVWEKVREDYLAGFPTSQICARHGVGRTALRTRATQGCWARAQHVWSPSNRLDPEDEGVVLEEQVDGDLNKVELRQLAFVATRRMMRAVMRGHAADALRWHRVRLMLDLEDQEMERLIAQQESVRQYLYGDPPGTGPDPEAGGQAAPAAQTASDSEPLVDGS